MGPECQGRATGFHRLLFTHFPTQLRVDPPTVDPPSSQETSPGPLSSMGSFSVGGREAEREAPSLCSREWSALFAGPVCTPKPSSTGSGQQPDPSAPEELWFLPRVKEQLADPVVSSQASGQPTDPECSHPHGPQRWCPEVLPSLWCLCLFPLAGVAEWVRRSRRLLS